MTQPVLPPYDHTPVSYNGPSFEETLALRKQFLNPGLFLYYKKPLMIVEGSMQYVYDETGKRYLDAFGGIVTVSVGHAHPEVVQAANEQMNKISHAPTIYLNPAIAEYAEKLASKMPGNLKVCYFVNSGSEANDLALLMALHGKLRCDRSPKCLPRRSRFNHGFDLTELLEI
jgi:alanine-glyoxylate transaminase / (R)-3-amino-2-methylpropionate-pyruvate transaminase